MEGAKNMVVSMAVVVLLLAQSRSFQQTDERAGFNKPPHIGVESDIGGRCPLFSVHIEQHRSIAKPASVGSQK
jgi:hypothetical protein